MKYIVLIIIGAISAIVGRIILNKINKNMVTNWWSLLLSEVLSLLSWWLCGSGYRLSFWIRRRRDTWYYECYRSGVIVMCLLADLQDLQSQPLFLDY